MSYDENRISDLIDGGLLQKKDWNFLMDMYNHISILWFNIPDYKKQKFEGTATYRALQNRILLGSLNEALNFCNIFFNEYKIYEKINRHKK